MKVSKKLILLALLLGITFCSLPLNAALEKHADPGKSCTSGDCHSSVIKHKYLHGPLAVNQCLVCHTPKNIEKHTFSLPKSETALCQKCHQRVDTDKHLHDPVAKGQCLICHDPHGSEERSQIKASPVSKLCHRCHQKVITKKYAHGPAAYGHCTVCHQPHGSKAKNLLNSQGNKICLDCHTAMRAVNKPNKYHVHSVAQKDCKTCHRTHDSDYKNLLTKALPLLCLDCHGEIQKKSMAANFKHGALTKGQACVNCHSPHFSSKAKLLRKKTADLCYSCHDDLKKEIANSKFKHGPVADKNCSACHQTHGSKFPKLLDNYFPADLYSPYDPKKYAFCFNCHQQEIVQDKETDIFTNFRNGKINLHYLHVNKKIKGRTCRTCHAVHASNNKDHIREELPFGSWKVPIHFNKTKTGGSCVTGCHKKYSYDRQNPLPMVAK